MTTAPFLSFAFPPTGGPSPGRTMPTRIGETVNVKDYGAKGDGITNDLSALNSAVAAAFGTVSSPNGQANPQLNKPLVFPPGHYIITGTLLIPSTYTGRIIGAGRDCTIIENTTPGSSVVQTNGWTYGAVENMTFRGAGNVGSSVAFDWYMLVIGGIHQVVGNQLCLFANCAFENCNVGLRCGASNDYGQSPQSDTSVFIGNRFSNNFQGIYCAQANAISNTLIGSAFINNSYGIETGAGQISSIRGCSFSGSANYDISTSQGSGDPLAVSGCYSTSTNFIIGGGYLAFAIDNCRHVNASSGYFIQNQNAPMVIRNCYSQNGQVLHVGGGIKWRVINSTFGRSDWFAVTSGHTYEPGNGTFGGAYLDIENVLQGPTPTVVQRERRYSLDGGTTISAQTYTVVP